MGIERRGRALEIRVAGDANGRKLAGYAATFNMPADIGGGFTETIHAGAFAASLRAKGDVVALVDHNPGQILARTRSGTLRLAGDMKALALELGVPDTSFGRDVLALAERGDLGGMSFGFRVVDDDWLPASAGTGFKRSRELRAVDRSRSRL
jgi:HK97 family phage prohead protease